MREFLTIKKSEFYAVHDIIMNPVEALEKIESKESKEPKVTDPSQKSWKQWARDSNLDNMKSFISRNAHTFNDS